MEHYFQKLPKGTPLPIHWNPSPSPKRLKIGPGSPPRVRVQPITPDDNTNDQHSESSESGEEERVERSHSGVLAMKRLYHPKQKLTVVAYARQHSTTAAAKKFSIPITTINHWMFDGHFSREVTKKGVKKEQVDRLHTQQSVTEDKLLVWVLENRGLLLFLS